ncbi:Mir1p [Saccharomyces cerevisiae]|nr:Mir1p [Saccharomyces cerevisiae]
MVPIDVVKTRIQLEPTVYNKGMVGSFKQIIAGEGAGALLTGFGPTLLGYSIQGAFKFGGYEVFKKFFIDNLGYDTASRYKNSVYMGSAAMAEFLADIALWFSRILKEEGIGSFYSGFTPILFKQIPYNIAKFLVFERASEFYYGFAGPKPADTLLSKVNKTKKAPGQSTVGLLAQLAKQLGFFGSFAGLPTRLVMVGTLTSLQFGIYGSLKSTLGCPPTIEIGGGGH